MEGEIPRIVSRNLKGVHYAIISIIYPAYYWLRFPDQRSRFFCRRKRQYRQTAARAFPDRRNDGSRHGDKPSGMFRQRDRIARRQ